MSEKYIRCPAITKQGKRCKHSMPIGQKMCNQHLTSQAINVEKKRIALERARERAREQAIIDRENKLWDHYYKQQGTSKTRGSMWKDEATKSRTAKYQSISALQSSGIPKDVIKHHIEPTRLGPRPSDVRKNPISIFHKGGRRRKSSKRRR